MDDLFAPPPPPEPAGGSSDAGAPPPPPPPPPGESLSAPTAPGPSADPAPTPTPTPAASAPMPPPEQPAYQPAYDPATQAAQAKKSGGRKTLLIVVIGVILLCCCITISAGAFVFQSGMLDDIASTTGAPEPGGMSTSDQGHVADAGTVAVWLSWESGADMDLEIWDSTGESYMTKSYSYIGDDITDGATGDEYFEFASYSGQDFSFGEYVVSVYYFGGDGPPEVPVTVTVQDVEGRVQTFTKSVQYDPTYDQWHAFRIDAATGYVTPLDEWY